MVKAVVWVALPLIVFPATAIAKNTRFWNLTAHTITSVKLSPAGKNAWGRNQTDNDPDHTVDHDERLKITGLTTGVYDVQLVDDGGRRCIVENVPIDEGSVFEIEERNLDHCTK
jgi:hypothetical protein